MAGSISRPARRRPPATRARKASVSPSMKCAAIFGVSTVITEIAAIPIGTWKKAKAVT